MQISKSIVSLILMAGLVAGCLSADKPAPGPNVLLISLDTTCRDHLSVYGYGQRTTPFLEELAAQSTMFSSAYAPAPATAPSHATLFTSLSPLTHRVIKNAVSLSDHNLTLAELLAERGFQTAAILSSFVLNAKFGLNQGFQHYDDRLDGSSASIDWQEWEGQKVDGGFDRIAAETTDHALAWLRDGREPGKPFFLFVHYFDPHDPYVPPAEYRGRFGDERIGHPGLRRLIGDYDGEIAYTDDQLRRLLAVLDELRLTRDTIVIIAGDHGEGLWLRGYQYHGAQIYDEAVRVPLLFRWPDRILPGRMLEGVVTLADVVPTLCDLLGIPQDGLGFQGRSLARSLAGGVPPSPDLPAFLYRIPYEPHNEFGVWVDGEKHGVRFRNWKYLMAENEGTTELYDLDRDPWETKNLVDDKPAVAAELAGMLADWRQAVTLPDSLTVRPDLSDADIRKLKSLGYVR